MGQSATGSRERAGLVGVLHQFDENAAGIFRMGEVDAGSACSWARCVVQQADAGLLEVSAHRMDIGHRVGHLLNPRSIAIEEATDRGILRQRGKELDPRSRGADREHGLANSLFLVGFLMDDTHSEGACVKVDSFIEVGHGDTDVIDARYPLVHDNYGGTNRSPLHGWKE